MADFKPSTPYNVPAVLQIPQEKTIKGVKKKIYEGGENIFISFRTFGGTEKTSNDQIVVEDTGLVETWFRPDIKSDCRILIGEEKYEILGTPENIGMRNMYLVFKVRALKGGA